MRRYHHFWPKVTLLAAIAALLLPAMASAAGKASTQQSQASNQTVVQGYGSDKPLQPGTIVKLKDSNGSEVEPLTSKDITKMLGVVVAAGDAPVTLSDSSNQNQTYVATFGQHDVLVSTQNGTIKTGDYITLSALAGIGMKVDTSQPLVLGRAAGNFTGKGTNVAGSASLKAADGHKVSVSIGRIPVDISIGHNPLAVQNQQSNLPGFLQKVSQSIAGKAIGAERVYLALVVLLLTAFVTAAMLYSGIRGGLISIGRNPLAKKEVVRGIIRVVLAGVVVFLIGLFGVYLLLKL